MPTLIDLTGRRFGTFTVRSRAPGVDDARAAWWIVDCDCGQERQFRTDILRGLKTRCWRCSDGPRPRGTSQLISEGSLAEIVAANSEFITECGCQIWTAGADGNGYGQFRFEGKLIGSHRASWIASRGPIPNGLHVLHRCDTPPCINPDHLFLGTPADNVADMIRKGRHRRARAHLYR